MLKVNTVRLGEQTVLKNPYYQTVKKSLEWNSDAELDQAIEEFENGTFIKTRNE